MEEEKIINRSGGEIYVMESSDAHANREVLLCKGHILPS